MIMTLSLYTCQMSFIVQLDYDTFAFLDKVLSRAVKVRDREIARLWSNQDRTGQCIEAIP